MSFSLQVKILKCFSFFPTEKSQICLDLMFNFWNTHIYMQARYTHTTNIRLISTKERLKKDLQWHFQNNSYPVIVCTVTVPSF